MLSTHMADLYHSEFVIWSGKVNLNMTIPLTASIAEWQLLPLIGIEENTCKHISTRWVEYSDWLSTVNQGKLYSTNECGTRLFVETLFSCHKSYSCSFFYSSISINGLGVRLKIGTDKINCDNFDQQQPRCWESAGRWRIAMLTASGLSYDNQGWHISDKNPKTTVADSDSCGVSTIKNNKSIYTNTLDYNWHTQTTTKYGRCQRSDSS